VHRNFCYFDGCEEVHDFIGFLACTMLSIRLSAKQKARLAKEITRAHTEITGAAGLFAQVIFNEVPEGNHFIGGAPVRLGQIFIHGQIRAGCSAVDRQKLMTRLLKVASEVSGLPTNAAWVYIVELPARCMAEYGYILPEPGDEQSWAAALPAADRECMQSAG
jgi:phenylpyruvate tautomerase PptA (4-oxalocrotonate tautomerase family)